jgi:hypothetical protein
MRNTAIQVKNKQEALIALGAMDAMSKGKDVLGRDSSVEIINGKNRVYSYVLAGFLKDGRIVFNVSGFCPSSHKEFPCDRLSDALKYFIGGPKSLPEAIRITEEHTAIVRENYIEVGCQKIDFEVVKKLYRAILKVEKESKDSA